MPRIGILRFLFAFLAFSAAPLFAQADMVLVEGGTFQMGSATGGSDERPVHEVTLRSFYMGKYEVTQKEWAEIMGNNPGTFKSDTLPVENISWYEAVEYCNKLSLKEGLTPAYRGSGDAITCGFDASGYRLPTEAEWEYAARGGNKDAIPYEYSGGNNPDAAAWYSGNSGNRTRPAGTKQPNSLGIYDMSGNVAEWCGDWYERNYTGGAQTNPIGPSSGTVRVLRGGGWRGSATAVRSAYRGNGAPSSRAGDLGFRVARSLPAPFEGERAGDADQNAGGGAAPAGNIPADMVSVEGGTFQMGSDNGDSNEKPVHTVTLRSFYMGKYEVTQKEWAEIMGATAIQQRDIAKRRWSSSEIGDNYPIYYVNWYDAVEYCNRLSQKEGLTSAYQGIGYNTICDFNASGYRLPTEAEWEYAARGGNKDAIPYEYSGGNSLDEVAWYGGNSDDRIHPVGTKQPNSLGLCDMSGNLWEWCWDWYGRSYMGGAQTNPTGPSSGRYRIIRGGGWEFSAARLRSATREYTDPSNRIGELGFRVVRPQLAGLPVTGDAGQKAVAPAPTENISAAMAPVEGGTFQMGSDNGDDDERPVHTVTVGSFYMGRTEVTQEEWAALMGNNKSHFRGNNLPVENITWEEAVEYCNRLSLKEGLTLAYRGSEDDIICDFNATGYRLPTEAEWEYAARGGNKGPMTWEYAGGNRIDEVAWYDRNSGDRTHPVGTKQPNRLGIYDMSGNVGEWCWDWYGSYSGGSQTDPTGPSSGTLRVCRGGDWYSRAADARSANRINGAPFVWYLCGFRVVRSRL
jgi:formylglycine-generating enzyme required for sulfatase activity